MGKIYYVMGKSSSGKDTIYKKLIKDEELNLKNLIGYTTRPMREGEKDGREYFFVTEETLKNLEEEKKVIEVRCYDTVYGKWYYFTVDDGQVEFDKNDYLLIGTLEAYERVRYYYGNDFVVPIYVNVEDGERLIRAINREKQEKEPKYAELCRRFLADEQDFSDTKLKKAGIEKKYENNDLSECYNLIKEEILNA